MVLSMRVYAYMCTRVFACVCLCARVCVCMCVCVAFVQLSFKTCHLWAVDRLRTTKEKRERLKGGDNIKFIGVGFEIRMVVRFWDRNEMKKFHRMQVVRIK